MSEKQPSPKTTRKVRVPRPDELSSETFEFIAAIDEFKRSNMVSIVTLSDVVSLLGQLGYLPAKVEESELADLEAAVERYKENNGRLFPNWSEIFQCVLELGYARKVA